MFDWERNCERIYGYDSWESIHIHSKFNLYYYGGIEYKFEDIKIENYKRDKRERYLLIFLFLKKNKYFHFISLHILKSMLE